MKISKQEKEEDIIQQNRDQRRLEIREREREEKTLIATNEHQCITTITIIITPVIFHRGRVHSLFREILAPCVPLR